MGLTDSNSKPQEDIQQKYKLIRRYTSNCYGDLTVIQNKTTQQIYALKQLITQDQQAIQFIKKRKTLKQRSLAGMEDYWFCGQQSICSNIRKVEMVYEYYSHTLDEQMQRRTENGQNFSDNEIMQIFTDGVQCLQYLQGHGILHVVGSMKILLYDPESRGIKIMENQQMIIHSQINTSNHNNTQQNNPARKKMLNIISLLGNKKYLPLHPNNEPKDVCDVCLDEDKVTHQNLFTLGLICMGLCWMKQPLDLGIFGKGGYNFEKIDKRINQIRNKFPSIHKILNFYMTQKKRLDKYGYMDILCEINSRKRSITKQNEKNPRLIDIQPIEKVGGGQKRGKKLSYLRQMRLSNHNIPNQF